MCAVYNISVFIQVTYILLRQTPHFINATELHRNNTMYNVYTFMFNGTFQRMSK